jgi:hypothetical protein
VQQAAAARSGLCFGDVLTGVGFKGFSETLDMTESRQLERMHAAGS